MTVADQIQASISIGEALDWQRLRDQLDQEHASAGGVEEQQSLLDTFTTLMDLAEYIETTPDTLAVFRRYRRKSYHRLLLREAGSGGVAREHALDAITAREVRVGRMAFDDPLREAAVQALVGLSRPPPSEARDRMPSHRVVPASTARSAWQGLFAWMAARVRRPGGFAWGPARPSRY